MVHVATTYPRWTYYPRNVAAPDWVQGFVDVVRASESAVSTEKQATGLSSDSVLAALRQGLLSLGFAVETGKTAAGKIRRPVLFGENGQAEVAYEVDAFHAEHGIVVEVEAGRGARGNAGYRDIIRTSLMLDARYFALLLPLAYRHKSSNKVVSVAAYMDAQHQLNAIYASQRLRLPFEGVLLLGY